ncbi:MAG: Holliday junction branch migration protein RuvA [Candidatus Zipacnadales bacterium]
MIRYIKGELIEIGNEHAVIETGGLGYEVIVPELLAERLAARGPGAEVTLYTYHYMTVEHSRATPMLLGFESCAQRAFFERLLEVPRLGPRQACRMLAAPVANIARAIELGDITFLRSLPGVGATRARDIANALKGKVAEFAMMHEEVVVGGPPSEEPTVENDAIEILTQLGYPMVEARERVLRALTRKPSLVTVETLVAEALTEGG